MEAAAAATSPVDTATLIAEPSSHSTLECPQEDRVAKDCVERGPSAEEAAEEGVVPRKPLVEDGATLPPVLKLLPTGRKPMELEGSGQPSSPRRVHWDEEAIAEHDKERGTRQKIDEPDTPFVRSPQKESDSEGGPSDDDQHRLSFRQNFSVPGLSPEEMPPNPALVAASAASAKCDDGCTDGNDCPNSAAGADVDPQVLARRLDLWMQSGCNQRPTSAGSSSVGSGDHEYHGDAENSGPGSGCSSRSSSSARLPAESSNFDGSSSRHRGSKEERRISLPEETPAPKPTSDFFKAKRAQHYNEIAALKAYKPCSDEESSTNSDTSNEGDAVTMTNTNTNINRTMSKDNVDKGRRRVAPASHSGSCDSRKLSPGGSDEHESSRHAKERGVAFCGGQSSGVVEQRSHFDSTSDSLVDQRDSDKGSFQAGEATRLAGAGVGTDWKAKRQAHYSEMAAALRARPPPSDEEEDEDDDDEDEE